MLKLVTSNIRFDNEEDEHNAWSCRKNFLSKTLAHLDPLFIGTQEGREAQLRELENLLSNYQLSDKSRVWVEPRMYPCLFYKKEVTVLNSGDFWLSNTPNVVGSKSFGSTFPRLCTWSELEHLGGNIFIFNVHLDHLLDEVRQDQGKVLIEQIQKINRKKNPLFLMGDFNCGPNSSVYNMLLKELDLLDPWRELGHAEETSYHRFLGQFDDGKRIDWILHSKEFSCQRVELVKAHNDGKYLSDHFPLYAEFSLR